MWDLFARGPRAKEQRRAVAQAMGPVWEANHVWLIFLIVGLFTAFPAAFGILSMALYLPFTIALLGIVLRGAAFAFRAHGREAVGDASGWGVTFGAASVIAPFFMATGAAAVASGSIRVVGGQLGSGFEAGWATPYGLLIGVLAVAMCAYLAATYLTVETEGKATAAGLVAGVAAIASLVLAPFAAPSLAHTLFGGGVPFVILALVNGPIALIAVWRSRPRLARFAVAAQVVFVLWAWAVGQWPYLAPPDLTIQGSAAPKATLTALLVVIAAGMALLLPSLWFLFRVFKARNPAALD